MKPYLILSMIAAVVLIGSESRVKAEQLSSFAVDPHPWRHIFANSEQRHPLYVGARPRDMILYNNIQERPLLPENLRLSGERDVVAVSNGRTNIPSGPGDLELEAWPVANDFGQLAWSFARWRDADHREWQWVEGKNPDGDPYFLPVVLDPSDPKNRSAIFDDFLSYNDLYLKPKFGECVWTSHAGDFIFGAWNPPDAASNYVGQLPSRREPQVCRVIRPPPRLNSAPITFVLKVSNGKVTWPASIVWTKKELKLEPKLRSGGAESFRTLNWPVDLDDSYEADVTTLSGETEWMSHDGKRMRFIRKNNAQTDNQLNEVGAFLEERYHSLGLKTYRQEFKWRGMTHFNLIAVIKGTDANAATRPVILADHFDTAFCEDVFEKSHQRVSAPGADDNMTATAALLAAAKTLKKERLRRDVWLVHLTGEEFPADDLGARKFVEQLLAQKRDISGVILMDMIGYSPKNLKAPIFQINAGDSPESEEIAQLAGRTARNVAPQLKGILRSRFDPRSYLYNTDGIIFSDMGFPVILLNEHINALENLNRTGYHQTTDTTRLINWNYALSIVKVAIQTAAILAR